MAAMRVALMAALRVERRAGCLASKKVEHWAA